MRRIRNPGRFQSARSAAAAMRGVANGIETGGISEMVSFEVKCRFASKEEIAYSLKKGAEKAESKGKV